MRQWSGPALVLLLFLLLLNNNTNRRTGAHSPHPAPSGASSGGHFKARESGGGEASRRSGPSHLLADHLSVAWSVLSWLGGDVGNPVCCRFDCTYDALILVSRVFTASMVGLIEAESRASDQTIACESSGGPPARHLGQCSQHLALVEVCRVGQESK